jgi:hypothetical protein
MTVDQKNKLEEENDKQAEEIKSLKAQLSDAQKDNKKLKGGIFNMTFEPSKLLILSRNLECYSAALAGLLTGRHEEEVSGVRGDVLKELSVVHERARKAMRNMAKALWPSDAPPESMEGLANLFKGAQRHFELWKTSACREGAREAWAMVKTRYTGLDPNRMARVGPQGLDGKEIPVNLVYDQVMIAAKYSQEDCSLSSHIDDIDKE